MRVTLLWLHTTTWHCPDSQTAAKAPITCNMVFTDNDEDSTEDEYDLDGAAVRPAEPIGRNVATAANNPTTNLSEEDSTPPPRKRRQLSVSSESDDLAKDDSAYQKWANKKKDARSKAVKSARKARAVEAANHPPPSRENGKTGIGRQAARKKRVKERKYGDSTSEDDELMEWTIPDYLQQRRKTFDDRRDRLKEGGLLLPPLFDDIYFSDDDRIETLEEKPNIKLRPEARPYTDEELPYSLGLIPASIAQHLRQYQIEGAQFLHQMFVYQKGAILGDDMGLGKTIQVIAFLTAAYGKTGDERDRKRMRKLQDAGKTCFRTLIICPGSLMANWQDELRRWGWWHSSIFHGSAAQKEEVLQSAQAGRLEIMITTYDTYRVAHERINMVRWDCVVADECHKIKERKAATTKILNQVNALCRIGLTGTAIQNKYEELWTLLNWTNPGRLGPVTQWKASVCQPLKAGQSHVATQHELGRARRVAEDLVKNLLPRFFKRRTKALIADQLPKKTDRVVFCPLTDTQVDAYQNFLASDIVTYIRDSTLICGCGSKKKQGWCCKMFLDDGTKWQQWVFPAIMTLQKLSNHLAILIPQSNDSKEKQDKDLDYLQIAFPKGWQQLYKERDSMIHMAKEEFCGKWRVLRKLLKFWYEEHEKNNKVLIFSHSVRLLKMLEKLFIRTSYNVKFLDGSMNYEDRYEAVNEFNTDPNQFVFLISTKAGGVGLNITSANKVVVVDPNWNPAYDLQAQDRAYRIGQTRDVEVFRLVSQGTMEEIIYARQIYKQQQANIGYNASTERRYFQGVQDSKAQKGEIFGLTNLFAWHDENVVLRDIVNKTNVAESRAGLQIANIEADEELIKTEADSDSDHHDSEMRIKTESDHEDAAMSQLAAEIAGRKPRGRAAKANKSGEAPKHDPVQAILASVGVIYTHENSEVIGSSTVEDKLSKAAQAAAAGKMNQMVFQPETQTHTSPRSARVYDVNGGIRYRHHPPDEVKRRQFGAMAKYAGYGTDVVSFAFMVEAWTQQERREFLTKWYEHRKNVMEGLEVEGVKDEGNTEEEVDIKHESDDDDFDEL